MLVIGIRRGLTTACWRSLHNDLHQSLSKTRFQPKTSGIIVTGDEVLKGQVFDTNSHFLCKELYKMGIQVMAVSKVSDNVNVISEEVKEFSRKYDYVLTTGGIGPTHDDITYEAIAKAFDDELHYHPELSDLVLKFYKTNDTNHPALKMAYIPKKAKLTYGFDPGLGKRAFYPSVSVENVHIYPGVPYLCERLFNFSKDILFSSSGKFHLRELYLTQNESLIVQELNQAVLKYPNVMFGSYPKFFHSYYSVKITIQSVNELEVNEALDYLRSLIPQNYLINFDGDPYSDKMNKISRFKETFFVNTVTQLEKILREKNPDDIFLYFDGGKDSTILLYIMSALYEKLFVGVQINAVYIETNPKVNKFIQKCVSDYNLNLLKLSQNNFRYLASCSPDICVLKGIRKSDLKAESIRKSFEGLNVVNPMSDWNYRDVWYAIRKLYLPYCELYDGGYTSISHINSGPNPNLKTTGPRPDLIYYKKAFELEDESLEYAM